MYIYKNKFFSHSPSIRQIMRQIPLALNLPEQYLSPDIHNPFEQTVPQVGIQHQALAQCQLIARFHLLHHVGGLLLTLLPPSGPPLPGQVRSSHDDISRITGDNPGVHDSVSNTTTVTIWGRRCDVGAGVGGGGRLAGNQFQGGYRCPEFRSAVRCADG